MSFVLKRELWVGTKKIGREGGVEGGKIEILSTSTSTQIPNYKTSKKEKTKQNDINKQHSKQTIRLGKLRKITECLLTRFSSDSR